MSTRVAFLALVVVVAMGALGARALALEDAVDLEHERIEILRELKALKVQELRQQKDKALQECLNTVRSIYPQCVSHCNKNSFFTNCAAHCRQRLEQKKQECYDRLG